MKTDSTNTTQGTWQDRLREEHHELSERLGKLRVFLSSPESFSLSTHNLELLRIQREVMSAYLMVLTSRMFLNGIMPVEVNFADADMVRESEGE